ncbi:hypothetical protein ACIQV2_27535 [Streptomyces globosus]|uniref:hypothetical protein n=1 Tax=Streptomyces globosus TaxID=68209 RepID=UPI0037F67AE3
MTVEQSRMTEQPALPRMPLRELMLRAALEERAPVENPFAVAAREYLSAPGVGEARLSRRRAGGAA